MNWIGEPLRLEDTLDPAVYRLVADFGFCDAKGRYWMAKAGTLTDGASIPRLFWRLCGPPIGGSYTRAGVIHDSYYQTHAAPKHKVDEMFYSAMLFNGTPGWKAWSMWKAVSWFGGPAWKSKGATWLKAIVTKSGTTF